MSKSFPFGAGAPLRAPLLLLMLTVILLGACSQQHPQQAGKPVPSPQTLPPISAIPENPATAASEGEAQSAKPSHAGDARTYSGTGVVTVVNRKEGWVEINHREIKGLMPAMQMAWYVKRVSVIGSTKVGDTVDFEIEYLRGSEVITKLEKVQSR